MLDVCETENQTRDTTHCGARLTAPGGGVSQTAVYDTCWIGYARVSRLGWWKLSVKLARQRAEREQPRHEAQLVVRVARGDELRHLVELREVSRLAASWQSARPPVAEEDDLGRRFTLRFRKVMMSQSAHVFVQVQMCHT